MTKLVWKKIRDIDSEQAFSGKLCVGFVVKLDDGTGYVYEVTAVYLKRIIPNYGTMANLEAAKERLQKDWDIWCKYANLVSGEST